MNTINGYKIDFKTNTLIMNYKFSKAAMVYGSEEYNLRKAILTDFPGMRTEIQSGRTKKSTSKSKRLTYNNMKLYISTFPNKDELLDEFEYTVKKSKVQKSPYKYVSDWFKNTFPNYSSDAEYTAIVESADVAVKVNGDTAIILDKASGF
ncbi:MAG: hypothetical protein E7582_07280 [Ruminococcaceae bacterium]|nr:hypothetical protein [Oscillospiraceae bacterium]